MTQPLYDNGFSDKVDKAVEAGLLNRSVEPDGVVKYSLTQRGAAQLKVEMLRKMGFNV